jgi:hypothetical protein
MPDSTQAPDEEQEFAQWLDELESEEDKAVAVAEREDKQAQKTDHQQKAKHEEEGVVTRSEYIADKFLSDATDDEKRIFAIYRKGDEDPRQMSALIDLARTKVAEADKTLSAEVDEKADRLADEKAKDAYGVGPISKGEPSRQMTPQEEFDLMARNARETKDTHISFKLWNALPGSGEVSPSD